MASIVDSDFGQLSSDLLTFHSRYQPPESTAVYGVTGAGRAMVLLCCSCCCWGGLHKRTLFEAKVFVDWAQACLSCWAGSSLPFASCGCSFVHCSHCLNTCRLVHKHTNKCNVEVLCKLWLHRDCTARDSRIKVRLSFYLQQADMCVYTLMNAGRTSAPAPRTIEWATNATVSK